MTAERNLGEPAQTTEDLKALAHQDLGVYGAGVDDLPEGRTGFVMLVEAGMPDEFKNILVAAVSDGNVRFVEVSEPQPQAIITLAEEATNHQHEVDSFWNQLDQIRDLPQGTSRAEVGRAGEVDALEDGRNEA